MQNGHKKKYYLLTFSRTQHIFLNSKIKSIDNFLNQFKQSIFFKLKLNLRDFIGLNIVSFLVFNGRLNIF